MQGETSGTYYVIVVANAENTLFEGTTANNLRASSAVNVTLPALPLLQVNSLTPAAHAVYPGQTINVGWNVANGGTAAANGSWIDSVYAVSDPQGDNPTLLASTATHTGGLAVGRAIR